MVREDYLFVVLLIATLIFFVHWGDMNHHLRH